MVHLADKLVCLEIERKISGGEQGKWMERVRDIICSPSSRENHSFQNTFISPVARLRKKKKPSGHLRQIILVFSPYSSYCHPTNFIPFRRLKLFLCYLNSMETCHLHTQTLFTKELRSCIRCFTAFSGGVSGEMRGILHCD